ncbi:MAG: guanylate kinase [Fusobacteriaceae bacterium]|jgi:guanylate kinase|nr:guanylate kinase [Fusobacteriaceae bacterium]
MKKGKLFVVSGPSGAGKSTICKEVGKMIRIKLAISATTREPRAGEKNKVDYYFMTKEEYLRRRQNDEFLETAEVHGNYYGTLKEEVDESLSNGENIILEIDVQGGLQIKKKYPESKLIFFKTFTEKELENRLRNRKTEAEDKIMLRLKNSLEELKHEKEYDITIINNTVEQACSDLIKIIENENMG